jgi:hypothetical protein
MPPKGSTDSQILTHRAERGGVDRDSEFVDAVEGEQPGVVGPRLIAVRRWRPPNGTNL